VPQDDWLRLSVQRQQPVVKAYPSSPSALAITEIARRTALAGTDRTARRRRVLPRTHPQAARGGRMKGAAQYREVQRSAANEVIAQHSDLVRASPTWPRACRPASKSTI
jgi:hypothetical protein